MRTEKDSMGSMKVPDSAYYGASTARALVNFPISGITFSHDFISALATIKKAAATVNARNKDLPKNISTAIQRAADEVIKGSLSEQFVVDIFQTGSGTSTNMNANEVIANRATEILGGARGEKLVHPNDHVNMSQSSNDVIPSALHVALALALTEKLFPALETLAAALSKKSKEFKSVVKAGRTHLQDATPVTLGQEFGGYAAQIKKCHLRLKKSLDSVSELALGGTAVGTGLNAKKGFAADTIKEIGRLSGFSFREADNHFEAQSARDAAVEVSGQLKTLAVALMKIANDIRWMAAGPRCNLHEIDIPEVQPGSSIMPGKVNPVICESVMMVAAQVIGNDAAITVGGQHGNFELNVMIPVIAYNLLQSVELLASTSSNFTSRCINGIVANEERCREYAEATLATCTALAPVIGYDKASELSKKALKENRTIREVTLEDGLLSEKELKTILDLKKMI